MMNKPDVYLIAELENTYREAVKGTRRTEDTQDSITCAMFDKIKMDTERLLIYLKE